MRWSLDDAGGHAIMVRRLGVEAGAGPEVVWLHGLGEWSLSFDPVVAHPALAGFEHALIDLPGYGRSPWPDGDPDDLARLADRIAAWIGDRRPALVGHSMGGVLATLIAERCPVRAVVDVEGNLSRGDCVFSAKGAGYTLDQLLDHGFDEIRAGVFERGPREPAMRGYHAALAVASPRVFHHHAGQLVALSEPETLVAQLAALRAPTLFVAGVPDGMCPRSLELLAEHGVRWVGLEPAGHWVFLDQLDAFAQAVGEFLRAA